MKNEGNPSATVGEEEPPDLKKEDFMDRQTTFFKSWQKRYFVLDGQTLRWYYNPDSATNPKTKRKPLGMIDIDRCKTEVVENKKNIGFLFKVTLRSGKKSFMFRTDSQKGRAEWIDMIQKSGDQTHELLARLATQDECVNCVALAAMEGAKEEVIEEKKEDEKEGEDEATKLANLKLKDVNGQEHLLKEVFTVAQQKKSAAELSSIKSQLDAMNVGLVAVGSGTSFMAKNFAEEFGFKGHLYVDQSLAVYKTLNCARGVKVILAFKAMKKVKDAYAEGFSQGTTQGDGLQLGGAFLLNPKCEVLWQHLEKFAGDHADLDEILDACRSAKGGQKEVTGDVEADRGQNGVQAAET